MERVVTSALWGLGEREREACVNVSNRLVHSWFPSISYSKNVYFS